MIGISNVKEKIYDQSVSKGEDLKNITSETENQLNSKSQPEAHNNVVVEDKNNLEGHNVLKILKMEKGNFNEICW